ncbi:MAG: hypothetical protein ACE5FU_06050, partial [Nitrospinota bacterium]
SIWPGSLPATLPVGFYVHQRATWKGGQWELDTPHELSMLFGGVWGESISFFGEWLAWEEDKFGRDKLVNFEIQFNDIFMEDVFNIKIGRHEVMAIESFKEDNRLTLEHYNTWDKKVDGTFNLRTPQPGIVANGIVADRFEYSVGMVNGSNKSKTLGSCSATSTTDEAGETISSSCSVTTSHTGNTFEDNNKKDYYGRVAFKFGGMPLTGPELGDDLPTRGNWRDDSIQVAGFGYWANPVTDKLSFYGLNLRANYSRYELGGTYVVGKVDIADADDKEMAAWFVEGQARIFPWMFGIVRYEAENFTTGSVSNDHDARWIFNLTMLQRANLRWTLEQVFYPRSGATDDDGTNSFKVNLLFAF